MGPAAPTLNPLVLMVELKASWIGRATVMAAVGWSVALDMTRGTPAAPRAASDGIPSVPLLMVVPPACVFVPVSVKVLLWRTNRPAPDRLPAYDVLPPYTV